MTDMYLVEFQLFSEPYFNRKSLSTLLMSARHSTTSALFFWFDYKCRSRRNFDHEVHHYSLSLTSFDSCLFNGVPVVRVSVLFLMICVHVGLFYFGLGFLPLALSKFFTFIKIKTKTTTVALVKTN